MRRNERSAPTSTKHDGVFQGSLRIRPVRGMGDEREHRADRAFFFQGMARKRLRRFPWSDFHA
jgi:hypothetical protein